MSTPHYVWRKLTSQQQGELLCSRKQHGNPWHSPPHHLTSQGQDFLISAACYEHAPILGSSLERMDQFSASLLSMFEQNVAWIHGWCVLPNHYHVLIATTDVAHVLREIGHLHGRTSHAWNGDDNLRQRKVFFRATERQLRSRRHYFAALNYVHHNPVRHGYTDKWTDWPWSSAAEYLERIGQEEARRLWRAYPLHDFGEKWDPSGM